MRVGHRAQQLLRQQPLHHRHDARDVGIATGEVAVAVDIVEEELRRRPARGIGEEMGEAPAQPLRPASAAVPAASAGALRGSRVGIVQGLVAGQPASRRPDIDGS